MATNTNEHDVAALPEEAVPSSAEPWKRPLLLATLGLVLMLGGYAAASYVSETTQQREQTRRLEELRRLAAERQADGVDDALPARLKRIAPPGSNRPFQLPGRLAIYVGFLLFVMAGVIMYRSPPPPEINPKSEIRNPKENRNPKSEY